MISDGRGDSSPAYAGGQALHRRRQALPATSCWTISTARWHEWTRYSARQDTLLQMGGLVGSFALPGAALAPFWSCLWAGQWTHAGKGAVMGLGRYRLAG